MLAKGLMVSSGCDKMDALPAGRKVLMGGDSFVSPASLFPLSPASSGPRLPAFLLLTSIDVLVTGFCCSRSCRSISEMGSLGFSLSTGE